MRNRVYLLSPGLNEWVSYCTPVCHLIHATLNFIDQETFLLVFIYTILSKGSLWRHAAVNVYFRSSEFNKNQRREKKKSNPLMVHKHILQRKR